MTTQEPITGNDPTNGLAGDLEGDDGGAVEPTADKNVIQDVIPDLDDAGDDGESMRTPRPRTAKRASRKAPGKERSMSDTSGLPNTDAEGVPAEDKPERFEGQQRPGRAGSRARRDRAAGQSDQRRVRAARDGHRTGRRRGCDDR